MNNLIQLAEFHLMVLLFYGHTIFKRSIGRQMYMADNVQKKIEDIFEVTCGSWQGCNQSTVRNFLSQCQEHGVDPQYCLGWLEQNKEQITNWASFSHSALDWVNEHTSTGSPITLNNQTDQ